MGDESLNSLDACIAEYERQCDWLFGLIADPMGLRYLGPRDPRADYLERSRRMDSFLAHAGRPQAAFRSLHVAGTSGKGSVSAFCAVLLSACGQRTAVHTSPYVQICNEKLRCDGRMITPSQFTNLVRRFRALYEVWADARNELSYDQGWTALAFLWIAQQQVDWGVVEVGVGGRYDPTNVLDSELAVVTNVGLDHVDVLGGTLPEIAHHKAGIIKREGRVVTAVADPAALEVIEREAAEKGAELRQVKWEADEAGRLTVNTPGRSYTGIDASPQGRFQQVNAALAITAVDWLAEDFGFALPTDVIGPAIARARMPGRFEILQAEPTVVMDGAHNPHKMEALAASLESAYPGCKATILMGMIAGKSVEATIEPLLPLAREFVFAHFDVLGKARLSPERMQTALAALCPEMPSAVAPSALSAVDRFLETAGPGDLLLITGSLYFIGLAREKWYPCETLLRDLECPPG